MEIESGTIWIQGVEEGDALLCPWFNLPWLSPSPMSQQAISPLPLFRSECQILCTFPPSQPLITIFYSVYILKCILKESYHIFLSNPSTCNQLYQSSSIIFSQPLKQLYQILVKINFDIWFTPARDHAAEPITLINSFSGILHYSTNSFYSHNKASGTNSVDHHTPFKLPPRPW